MYAAADDAPALHDRGQGQGDQRPDGSEDQRRIERLGWPFLGASRPARTERAGEGLGRFVTRAREGVDLAALPAADLREDVSGRTEAVETDPPGSARAAQAPPPNQSCAHQGCGSDGIGEFIQREDIGRFGNNVRGEAAIAGVAGEFRGIA